MVCPLPASLTSGTDLPSGEERAACPRCGRLLAFPVVCERLACDNCRAEWLRPCTGSHPLAFDLGRRLLALGRRWVGAQHRPRFPFAHALHAEPEVRTLADRFGIPHHLRGTTQWERQRDLLRVLRIEVFRHRPSSRFLRALGLGTVTRTNDHWFCTHHAYLYSIFAASLGWTARILNIGRDHPEKTAAHMVAEVWSDEWQKWAVVDPLYAGWFSARGKGKGPLSFLEVHGDWVRHGGRNVVLHHRVRSSSANLIGPERTLPALKDDTKHRHLHPSTYFWGIACLSNRFLTEPYEEGRFLALLWRDRWNQGRPWLNRNQPVGYSRARHLVETDSPFDFHPPLNNTAIWIHRDPDRPRIFLRTSCPNFSHFEMKAGASWRRVPADFTFPSARGDFAWAFRAVNRFGVAGSASLLRGGVARNR